MKSLLMVVVGCLGLAVCTTGGEAAVVARVSKLSISFKWCGKGSPATKVSGIPAGTKMLRFKLTDHQAPSYHHGGGDYPASGGSVSVPCGALKASGYEGPHPPPPEVHDYEWTVTALDASGSAIAVGSAVRKFPQ